MAHLDLLLLPPLAALALCIHLGYPLARLALPDELRPYRVLLTPLAGCGLFLAIATALTTQTALTPPQIAAGLTVLIAPLNAWLLWRRMINGDQTIDDRRSTKPHRRSSIVYRRESARARILPSAPAPLDLALCLLLAALAFVLAILPPLRWGVSAPIGSNWDAAEFYVPLGRALQLSSQEQFAALGSNPLVRTFTRPPVSGRIHAFSYLHAVASSASGVEPLRSYVAIMALMLALQPLAIYPLGRVLGLPRGAALLSTALVTLAWLPLWATYNSFSNHLLGLALLPAALASSLVALRDGGRRALATGALFTAALAIGYYPALTVYVALLAPAGLWLLWRSAARVALVLRALALAALAFAISAPAQIYFFLRSGFLQEMLQTGTGFQISSFVGLADALGLAATFNRESLPSDARLVAAAAALALLLGIAALAGRRVPLLIAMALGAACYQGYTAARAYEYGFYKGVTFQIPIYALLIAAGAALVWERTMHIQQPASRLETTKTPRHQESAYKPLVSLCLGGSAPRTIFKSALVSWATRLLLCAGLALILGLNGWTVWRLQQRYSAAGPQLWSPAETDASELYAQVAPGASVLIVPSDAHGPVFNSLLSYALLGHQLAGRFETGFSGLDVPADRYPDTALLPDEADPADYGYQAADLHWAGAGMRLYGRADGVVSHRQFGEGGRYPALAPGASLTLRLGLDRIGLPGEAAPRGGPSRPAQLALAIASFGSAAVELSAPGLSERYVLPGGLVQLNSPQLTRPGEIQLRNTGEQAVYLWWGEIFDAAVPIGVVPRDDVFVQALAQLAGDGGRAGAALRVHTPALPQGAQKLTGILTVTHTPAGADSWKEIGQWVFFPSGGQRLSFDVDLSQLRASFSVDGRAAELIGSPQPAGDGNYGITLLLANNAKVVYATTLWTWSVRAGQVLNAAADPVMFDVVPLPRPATARQIDSRDGLIRLRGYTLLRDHLRPGETLPISLVWQSLGKLEADLRARVALRAASGQILAEQTLALGARDHGTSSWQEGELAEQSFALALPSDVATATATLSVELLAPDGRARPFASGEDTLRLADIHMQ